MRLICCLPVLLFLVLCYRRNHWTCLMCPRATPDSRKALQRYLGFVNFYRHLIRNCSQLVVPLTALTSTKVTFGWSSAAEAAFSNLKSHFVSAPILVTPDPSRQFVVEVNASEVGAGTVLSQHSLTDGKMHSCVFPIICHRSTQLQYW